MPIARLSALHRSLRQVVSTLKFKIVALAVAAGLLASMVAVHLALQANQADSQRLLLAGEATDRERIAALLGDKLALLEDALRALAVGVPTRHWQDPHALEAYLREQPAMQVMFESVSAVNAAGHMLARVEKGVSSTERRDVGDRAYFRQALRTDQPVVSSPVVGRISQAPTVIIAVAAQAPDGQVRGVLLGAIALHSTGLFAGLAQQRAEHRANETVIDRSGLILSHRRPERVLGQAVDEPGLRSVIGDWLARGSPIDTEGAARLTEGHLVTLAGIPGSDWMLVQATPQALALQPIEAARRRAWGLATPVALCIAWLAGLGAWLAVRPIVRLRQHAERLLQAPEATTAWPRESGELGQLAAVFAQVFDDSRRRQHQVQTLLLKLEAVLDHANVGIALTRDGRFELVSQHFCQLFDCSKAEAHGLPTRAIYPSDEVFARLVAEAGPAFTRDGAFSTEVELVSRQGRPFWGRLRGRAVTRGNVSDGTIWIIEDISEERSQREQLSWQARHDPLTGLCNRAAFEQRLDEVLRQRDGAPFCALFIDLDRFKLVNDSAGHAAGDALLKGVAAQLLHTVRQSDVVGRLGGDEFAVLLLNCPLAQGRVVAAKLRQAVADYQLAWDGQQYSVGASVGLVPGSDALRTTAAVLQAADAACYTAKGRGRNAVAVFSEPADA